MMRTLLAVLAVLACARPLAASCNATITPPERSNAWTEIELRVAGECSDNCVPGEPDVQIDGNRIDIAFEVGRGCPLPAVTPWADRVRLGRLSAGSYDVRVQINGAETARQTFTVSPGSVLPSSGTSGTRVTIVGVPRFCPVGAECPMTVRFGDQVATGVQFDAVRISVAAPPREPGTVPITITSPDGTYTIPNAFTYVEDPWAQSERVLFPILFEAAGAHGSRWTSEVIVRNTSAITVPFNDRRGILDPPMPLPYDHLEAGEEYRPFAAPRDGGVLFFVAPGVESGLRYASHFRDLSRGDSDLGTDVPVVREREAANLMRIVGVPNAPRYRAMLRIYDLDPQDAREVIVMLSRGNEVRTLLVSPVSSDASDPAFASVDLTPYAEALQGNEYDVTVAARMNDRRLWAFVSVTNNETQHVTTYTPQHATEPALDRPRLLPSTGMAGHEVIVRGAARELCNDECAVAVTFDGVASPRVRTVTENSIAAEVPAGTGVVDVTLTAENRSIVLPRAFSYVADLSGWTRVLVPLDYAGGGAHGSQWTTVTRIRNHSGIALPVPELVPNSAKDGGVFVHLPPGLEHQFAFSSHAVDLSRSASDLGTELRVARAELPGSPTFLGVPLDPRYRVRLRLYDFGEQHGVPVTVTVQPENGPERNIEVFFQAEPGRAPWLALDLESTGGPANVLVRGGSAQVTGFLTITNNETQHVTTWHAQ
jgi:hypothetical protein